MNVDELIRHENRGRQFTTAMLSLDFHPDAVEDACRAVTLPDFDLSAGYLREQARLSSTAPYPEHYAFLAGVRTVLDERWVARCADRFQEVAKLNREEALDYATTMLQHIEDFESPEEAADAKMEQWTE